jgi:CubicO group peptidase (beta-lactamase class C family)
MILRPFGGPTVPRLSLVLAVLLGSAVFGQRSDAQSLTFSLFAQYLDSFRNEAGIPGMSAAIVQDGVVVWERGLGRQNVETQAPATPDTPYLIGGLSQAFGATLLLRKCVDQWHAEVTDRVVRWLPLYPEPSTRLMDLLSHVAPGGSGFEYAPARFAVLTGVIRECAPVPYQRLLATEVFDRFAMGDSAPDQLLATPTSEDAAWFTPADLARYQGIVARMAVPYRVVGGRPQRNTDLAPKRADAADGIISSVRDLSRFDALLSSDALLSPPLRDLAWTQQWTGAIPLPTGLGWFVQNYNGEPLVWQFGLIPGGHASLLLKVPNRGLTMILLANSDGLNAPYGLAAGDVTTSIFARLFLRLFVP